MKKLLIVLLFIASIPAFAFDFPALAFIVHNNIANPSQVLSLSTGVITPQAQPGLNTFPWQGVFAACGNDIATRSHCQGVVFVDLPNGSKQTAGFIKVNANTGKIKVEKELNGYQITVNGKGNISLAKATA